MYVNRETGEAKVAVTVAQQQAFEQCFYLNQTGPMPDVVVFKTDEEVLIKGVRFRIVQVCRDNRLILKPLRQ